MHWQGRKVLAVEKNAAAIRRNQTDDHVKRRGFASTVWAEQAYDFAALYFDGNILDDFAEFVALGNVLNTEDAHELSSWFSPSGSSSALSAASSSPPLSAGVAAGCASRGV